MSEAQNDIQVVYSRKACEDLAVLSGHVAREIVEKVERYSRSKNPFRFARKMKNSRLGTYRYQVGHYRIIFDIECPKVRIASVYRSVCRDKVKIDKLKVLLVLMVKQRRNIYGRWTN